MPEYDVGPTFVQLDYVSPFGAHSHQIPAREWNSVPITGDMGSFTAWNGTPRDAEAMIDEFLLNIKALHRPGSSYTLATIFTKPTPTAPSIPVASKALAVVGTNTLTTHSKAIQSIMSMRTTLFHPVKLVFLDVPHDEGEFDKQNIGNMGASYVAVFDDFSSDENAWCGRDGAQPQTCISLTWNLNQALRKQYAMA